MTKIQIIQTIDNPGIAMVMYLLNNKWNEDISLTVAVAMKQLWRTAELSESTERKCLIFLY